MDKSRKFKRAASAGTLYSIKHSYFEFEGYWEAVLGQPEKNGAWLIYGAEKNGKTWFALMLANYLSGFKRVLYISAEEGKGKAFVDSCIRAKIEPNNRSILFTEYETIEELNARLKSRNAPAIVVMDNLTMYSDELKNGGFRSLLNENPNVLFIFLAHEERGAPYTATAKLCKKLSKIIFHVQGLVSNVSGRCPGGRLIIDEQKAALYHGQLK
jgi:hypothetical protein